MKIGVLICWLLPSLLQAQDTTRTISKYGLPVISKIVIYKNLVQQNGDNEMLDLRQLIPAAHFDVRYATANNLVKKAVYPTADVFMRKPAALALLQVQKSVEKLGYGLLFFDGYRPYSVTVLFYETIKDTIYVADPKRGSRHNRGMAIDLSLYDLTTGNPLPMPSAYDETNERAFHNYMGGDSTASANRGLLKAVMESAGFSIYAAEWWHYDFKGWQAAGIYDLWHTALRKANNRLAKKNMR
jgi:zinc D-Ala-D-Ala dipeptidase